MRGSTYAKTNFIACDLSYADLAFCKFVGANLKCSDLSHANISSTDFPESDLTSANFSDVTTDKYTDFKGAIINNTIGLKENGELVVSDGYYFLVSKENQPVEKYEFNYFGIHIKNNKFSNFINITTKNTPSIFRISFINEDTNNNSINYSEKEILKKGGPYYLEHMEECGVMQNLVSFFISKKEPLKSKGSCVTFDPTEEKLSIAGTQQKGMMRN